MKYKSKLANRIIMQADLYKVYFYTLLLYC